MITSTRRVLVVDDSRTTRAMLSAVIGDHPRLTVVGQAGNGKEAIDLARRRRPDIITMDLRMPHMDGLEATQRIMSEIPTPIVIVANSAHDLEVRASLEAMGLGALAILPKPLGPLSNEFEGDCDTLQRTLVALSEVSVVTRRPASRFERRRRTAHLRWRAGAHAIALAASTGGPQVLRRILGALPGDLPAPVMVVQHFAPGFVDGLVEWIGQSSPMDICVARHGEPLTRGRVYFAPDEVHLGVSRGRVHLEASAPIGRFRPSADFLFTSAAQVYGPHLFAAILTGMGRDGVAGLEIVQDTGGVAVAQDEASCTVYGMPREAVERKLVSASLSPSEIVKAITRAAIAEESDADPNVA